MQLLRSHLAIPPACFGLFTIKRDPTRITRCALQVWARHALHSGMRQSTTDVQDAQSAAKSCKTNQGVTWKTNKECFIWSDNYAWCFAIFPEITTRQIQGIGVNLPCYPLVSYIASSYNFSHEPVQILINKLHIYKNL